MVFTKVKQDAKYVFDAYLINSAEDGSVHEILLFKPVYKFRYSFFGVGSTVPSITVSEVLKTEIARPA